MAVASKTERKQQDGYTSLYRKTSQVRASRMCNLKITTIVCTNRKTSRKTIHSRVQYHRSFLSLHLSLSFRLKIGIIGSFAPY